MIMKEADIKTIAVGSMLTEGVVSIMALIAATSLLPLDYFQINVPVEKFQAILPKLHAMGFTESNLSQLSASVGEKIAGRTGGAVSLGCWYGLYILINSRHETSYVVLVPFCHYVRGFVHSYNNRCRYTDRKVFIAGSSWEGL